MGCTHPLVRTRYPVCPQYPDITPNPYPKSSLTLHPHWRPCAIFTQARWARGREAQELAVHVSTRITSSCRYNTYPPSDEVPTQSKASPSSNVALYLATWQVENTAEVDTFFLISTYDLVFSKMKHHGSIASLYNVVTKPATSSRPTLPVQLSLISTAVRHLPKFLGTLLKFCNAVDVLRPWMMTSCSHQFFRLAGEQTNHKGFWYLDYGMWGLRHDRPAVVITKIINGQSCFNPNIPCIISGGFILHQWNPGQRPSRGAVLWPANGCVLDAISTAARTKSSSLLRGSSRLSSSLEMGGWGLRFRCCMHRLEIRTIIPYT